MYNSAQALLSFGSDVWEKIVAYLSPQECEAFAATCREAWIRPLTKAVIAAPAQGWQQGAVSELSRARSVHRTRRVLKHGSTLRTLSLELWGISDDIQELASPIHNPSMPQLQQLSIKMSPKWATSVRSAQQSPRYEAQTVLPLLNDQLCAAKACLEALSRRAPNLRALSVIGDPTLRTLPPSFSALKHLILDLWEPALGVTWVPKLPQLKTLRVNTPVYCTWSMDLRAMTSLEYFSVVQQIPDDLQLPGPCQVHMGDTDDYRQRLLACVVDDTAPWHPWLTRMDIAIRGNRDWDCELLKLDLHLTELTVRSYDRYTTGSFAIAPNSLLTLRQAKHVTIYARDISIGIAADVNLAWLTVRIIVERELNLIFTEPEVLLAGRSAVMLKFAKTNYSDASVAWRPIAQRLGLRMMKSTSRHEDRVVETLCLSTGSKEDQKFMQAPCICRACMECLAYYDMLK